MVGRNVKISSSQISSGVGTSKSIIMLGVKADGLLGVCPAGYALEIATILETGGAPADIKIGTVAGADDILLATAIPANSSNFQGFGPVYSSNATVAAFNIFLSNNLAWVGVTLDVYLILRKVK